MMLRETHRRCAQRMIVDEKMTLLHYFNNIASLLYIYTITMTASAETTEPQYETLPLLPAQPIDMVTKSSQLLKVPWTGRIAA